MFDLIFGALGVDKNATLGLTIHPLFPWSWKKTLGGDQATFAKTLMWKIKLSGALIITIFYN